MLRYKTTNIVVSIIILLVTQFAISQPGKIDIKETTDSVTLTTLEDITMNKDDNILLKDVKLPFTGICKVKALGSFRANKGTYYYMIWLRAGDYWKQEAGLPTPGPTLVGYDGKQFGFSPQGDIFSCYTTIPRDGYLPIRLILSESHNVHDNAPDDKSPMTILAGFKIVISRLIK
ncbi:MAG: hypothetical protein WDA22_17610 [Bacteroidota bacterium]